MVARHVRRRDLGAGPRRPRPAPRCTRPTRRPSSTPGSPRSSWPRRSRDTGWVRPAKARTSPTSRRRWPRSSCARSATGSASTCPTRTIAELPFLRPAEDSPEMRYLRRAAGGPGRLPACRGARSPSRCEVPPLSAFDSQLKGTGEREISTTMAFVRILNTLLRDKEIGRRVVPIVPDESRTFGMEGMFRQFGIFSQVGQLYQPEDANQLMFYREDQDGPDAAGGHHRAGRDVVLDRRGDLLQHVGYADDPVLHLLLDVRFPAHRRPGLGGRGHAGRAGSCIGGTAGRTTLNGEGLQHQDGHSHIMLGDDPQLRVLRPDVRLRGRRHRARRACGGCTPSRRTSSTT